MESERTMSEEVMSADALLVEVARLREQLAQEEAKIAGLNLAADQYSESRDQWMLKAKAAEAERDRVAQAAEQGIAALNEALELAGTRMQQAERARDAERAARQSAEADAGWWHAAVANYVTSATYADRERLRATMADALTTLHPGRALLAELDAARAVVREARVIADADLLNTIARYDEARKARGE